MLAGTAIEIGLTGNIAFVTGKKEFVGKVFQVMLYVVGEPVVALYVNELNCEVLLKQTFAAVAAAVTLTFPIVAVSVLLKAKQPPETTLLR